MIVLRPESRGTVRIKSAEPRSAPAIQPRYLSARRIATRRWPACATLRRIMAAPAIAPFIEAEHEPGPACASEDDLLDYRAPAQRLDGVSSDLDLPHGQRSDGGGRCAPASVHGVERLRIVDASVMPALVSGNTNAPTIMIAEKGADMILRDARVASGTCATAA